MSWKPAYAWKLLNDGSTEDDLTPKIIVMKPWMSMRYTGKNAHLRKDRRSRRLARNYARILSIEMDKRNVRKAAHVASLNLMLYGQAVTHVDENGYHTPVESFAK